MNLVVIQDNPCGRCGACCKTFGGDGLPLYPWESRRYARLAHDRCLVFSSHPVPPMIADHKRCVNLIEGYRIQTEPCVFFDQAKGCTVYDDRFLVCKAHPYRTPQNSGALEYLRCTEVEKFKERAKKLELAGLMDTDPQVLASKEFSKVGETLARTLKKLEREGHLQLGPAVEGWESVDVDLFVNEYQ